LAGGIVKEISMRKQLLAGAMALALATMMTSGTMAQSQNDKGHSVRGKHAAIHGAHGGPGRRTVRGYSEPLNGDRRPGFSLGISGVGIGVDNDYGCSPSDKAYIGGFCGDYVPN
jgi:hypothetical protein